VSVAEAAHRSANTGRAVKLWLGFILVIAAGIGLAWIGAGSLRPELTPSGLQFRTVKGGTGDVIAPADAALMDYVLTSDDGTVLDSSDSHGGPQPFSMGQVFPGFAEAMTRMREGGQYRFTMPQRLAFGNNPAPQGFPAGTALTFDVRVRKVVRGGAAMVQQQGQPEQP
jgi:FKBP-type peptidyl-prolyl cis-trans isomerase FkpA